MLSRNIGAEDLRTLAIYKHSGVIYIYEGKKVFGGIKWSMRYAVICKGNTGTWHLFCYLSQFAKKAEEIYSMLEFESVKEYRNAKDRITGFRICFEDSTIAPLIFSCDTEDSQKVWTDCISCAIDEAHNFSADSAYASGESTRSDSNRLSKPYHTIDESYNEEIEKPELIDQELVVGKRSTFYLSVNSVDDSEVNVCSACNDHAIHGYANIGARNQGPGGQSTAGLKDFVGPAVKPLVSYQIPEGIAKQEESSTWTKRNETTVSAMKSNIKEETQKQPAISSELVEDSEPPYENIKFGETRHRMEDLKQLTLPSQDGDAIAHCDTAVKQIYNDDEQTDIKKDIRNDENHKKVMSELKLKFTDSHRRLHIDTESFLSVQSGQDTEGLSVQSGQNHELLQSNAVSFLSVRQDQDHGSLQTDAESFVSVNGATQSMTIQHHIEGCQIQSRVLDPTSVVGNNVSSCLSGSKYLSSSKEQSENSTRKRHLRSRTEGPISLASADEGHVSSTLAKSKSVASKKTPGEHLVSNRERQTHSRTADSNAAWSTFIPSGPSKRSGKEMEYSSLSKSEASSALDEDPIYENTDIFDAAQPNRNSTEAGSNIDSISSRDSGSHLICSKSTSSFSSCGSNASFKTYEIPDEGTQNVDENVFERHEYFFAEKKGISRIMKNTSVGTFLCCPGETTSEDLCVMTPCGKIFFRIYEQDGKYSLFKWSLNPAFPTLDSLLSHYHHFDLPSKDYTVKLVRGYKKIVHD